MTINKGDILAGTGTLNQFGILPAGSNGQSIVYDNTAATGLKAVNIVVPVATQEVYVSLQGNDSTGDGSVTNPWLTFAHAQATISPTTTSRYTIWVTPGFYSENISLHANVFIVATAPVETRLTGNIDINNSSWNTAGIDNRSGFMDIELRTGTQTYDFTAQAGNDSGKLYFNNVRMSTQPNITGLSTGQANQVILSNCYLFSGVKNTGAVVQITNTYNSGGAYENHSSAAASRLSDMEILGGCNDGTYSNAWTSNSACTMEIEGVGFNPSTTLTTSGTSATTTINGNSLPPRANITTSSGGTLTVTGDSSSINAKINFGRSFSGQTLAANTGRRPSTTNDTFINFSGSITNIAALNSNISLQASPDNSTWTTLQTFQMPLVATAQQAPFSALIPAGYYYQWIATTSAGGTTTISTIQELSL